MCDFFFGRVLASWLLVIIMMLACGILILMLLVLCCFDFVMSRVLFAIVIDCGFTTGSCSVIIMRGGVFCWLTLIGIIYVVAQLPESEYLI